MLTSIIEVLQKYGSMFGTGCIITVCLSIATVLFSVLFGSLFAFMKISKSRILKGISTVYVEFIRGTPLLVQVYMVFYGLPLLGVEFPSVTIMGTSFDRMFSGALALIINSTAYICEIVRGGILSIDGGQTEASRSIGFNKLQTMLYIVFPQAFKNILPALANEFVSVIKNSSQVSVIGLAELMYVTNTVRSISFRQFEPLIIVSVIYFILTSIISAVVRKMEKKLAVSNRRS